MRHPERGGAGTARAKTFAWPLSLDNPDSVDMFSGMCALTPMQFSALQVGS